MGAALRALFLLHVRQILRSGVGSGHPSLSVRGLGRRVYLLAVLLFFAWQVYRFGESWVSDHSTEAHTVVFLLLQPALTTLGSGAVIVIFFYAFTSLIGTFTNERDLRLLLLAPIAPAIVLGERILATSLGFSAILLIVVPALFAIGSGVGIAIAYYPAVLLAILLLPIAPTSLGALVLLPLLRWLPPARARTISMLVGVCLGLTIYVVSRSASSAGARSLPSAPNWLPSTWPGRLVAAIGLGDTRSALEYLALTIGLAAILFAFAAVIAGQVFASGSGSYHEVRRAPKQREAVAGATAITAPAGSMAATRRSRPGWWPVFIKDWRALRRDPQRLILLFYPLAIVGFNAFQILSRGRSSDPTTAVATTLILLIFASMLLVATTAPGLVNREGRALVLLALAPISPRGIVVSKWIVAAAPPLAVVEIALIGLAVYLGLPGGKVVLLAATLAALIFVLSGTTLTMNIAWPKLDATNPRRQSSVFASVVSLLLDAIICAGTGGLLFAGLFVLHGTLAVLAIVGLFVGLGLVTALLSRLAPRLLQSLMHSERLLGGAS